MSSEYRCEQNELIFWHSYLADATGKFGASPLLQGAAGVEDPPAIGTWKNFPRGVTLKAVPVVISSLFTIEVEKNL